MSDLFRQWREALSEIKVVHPDRRCTPMVALESGDPPRLTVGLDKAWSTRTGKFLRSPFIISNLSLTFFPGKKLAQQWFAAAWAGYLQHESLELTTVDGENILDPHENDIYNRGLRDGLPAILTPDAMFDALLTVMPAFAARKLFTSAGIELEIR